MPSSLKKSTQHLCSIVMRLINLLIAASALEAVATEDFVRKECILKAKRDLNFTSSKAFDETSSITTPTTDVDNIILSDLRPGLCETTFLVRNGKFYAHKESRSLLYKDKNTIYLRHRAFFLSSFEMLKETEKILSVKVPEIIFNLETQDNPTCRYPVTEIESGQIRAVKGLFHHSFCSPKLCNGIFLFPISYNQNFKAMEDTRKIDSHYSEIPWKSKQSKLFWRGSNAGKIKEYAHFYWKFSNLPRSKAVKMCKNRKDADVEFGFVPWKIFMKHKYILALAGNTYSSLFKHALRSGSCILRQEERMYEWFEPFLKEWVHYIPVKWDLSDLFVQLQWAKDHDKEAKEIGLRAKAIGEALFSPSLMACYIYCLLIQYHAKLRIDFKDEKLMDAFTEVRYICNSKRNKMNNCIKL